MVVYLVLAGCLFAEPDYLQVWQLLTAGLSGLAPAQPIDRRSYQATISIDIISDP